jgi:hypothetical protein
VPTRCNPRFWGGELGDHGCGCGREGEEEWELHCGVCGCGAAGCVPDLYTLDARRFGRATAAGFVRLCQFFGYVDMYITIIRSLKLPQQGEGKNAYTRY